MKKRHGIVLTLLIFVFLVSTPPLLAAYTDVEAFVARFYQQCLNRQPDAAGLAHWADCLANGDKTGDELARAFVFSDEFKAQNTSDAEFVTILYQAFFNRDPDTGGYDNWMNLLSSGTSRSAVLGGFTSAREFMNLCQDYDITAKRSGVSDTSIAAFVTRFYQQCLGREPDVQGLNNWVNDLNTGEKAGDEIARAFVFSDEFQAQNTSDAEFVTILYQAFFNRDPDTDGFNRWINLLSGGTSRSAVLDGFTAAREFLTLCENYQITANARDNPDSSIHNDDDGDGFTPAQGDCDDSNFGIRPGAPEICEDGIDQDCDGQDRTCQLYQCTCGGTYTYDSGLLTLDTTYSDFPADEGAPLGITTHDIFNLTATSFITMEDDDDAITWTRQSGLPDDLVGVWTQLEADDLDQLELRFQSDHTYTLTSNVVAWTPQNKTIIIDGDFSDWNTRDRIYIDRDGPECSNAPGQDIQEIYIARDTGFIYLRFVLNGPLDETVGYVFGSDQRSVGVTLGNGSGFIFYGNATGAPRPSIPQEFVKINGNQFECKFYAIDIESWKTIRWPAAWLNLGDQAQCHDHVVMTGLDLGL